MSVPQVPVQLKSALGPSRRIHAYLAEVASRNSPSGQASFRSTLWELSRPGDQQTQCAEGPISILQVPWRLHSLCLSHFETSAFSSHCPCFLRYEEDRHNCYSYTLTFINCILTTEGKEQLGKEEFTEKYVVPRTRKASKYITLYRAIEEHGFYVTDHPDEETSPPEGSGSC